MRALDLKPLGASQASIAELKVTVSHLDHLKSDVAGWISAAAEHGEVIEPKPGTRMVLGPLDSPNTLAQKRHAARQGLNKAGSFITDQPVAATIAGEGRPSEATQAPTKATELDSQLGSLEVGRCSLGVGMGRATWNKAAAERAANIMEGVRRSNASVQRISSREGIYRAIDSLPARE